jgi:3-isopropylmalate/(R)-2-methylmalate dehydratase small subunit
MTANSCSGPAIARRSSPGTGIKKRKHIKTGSILPITVSQEDLDKLFDDADRGSNATLTVDLEKQEIKGPDGGTITFEIDPFRKKCLMEGLDDIGLTMVKKASIDAYEAKAKENRAWL